MEVLFILIAIQLLCNGYQTFMDMAWISGGYGSDREGGGDSLLGFLQVVTRSIAKKINYPMFTELPSSPKEMQFSDLHFYLFIYFR